MVRVFLDECVDRRLANYLHGHAVSSSFSRRWQGLSDSALLSRCEGEIDAFVTTDANLAHQQNLGSRSFGVVVVHAGPGRLSELIALVGEIDSAVSSIEPGQ